MEKMEDDMSDGDFYENDDSERSSQSSEEREFDEYQHTSDKEDSIEFDEPDIQTSSDEEQVSAPVVPGFISGKAEIKAVEVLENVLGERIVFKVMGEEGKGFKKGDKYPEFLMRVSMEEFIDRLRKQEFDVSDIIIIFRGILFSKIRVTNGETLYNYVKREGLNDYVLEVLVQTFGNELGSEIYSNALLDIEKSDLYDRDLFTTILLILREPPYSHNKKSIYRPLYLDLYAHLSGVSREKVSKTSISYNENSRKFTIREDDSANQTALGDRAISKLIGVILDSIERSKDRDYFISKIIDGSRPGEVKIGDVKRSFSFEEKLSLMRRIHLNEIIEVTSKVEDIEDEDLRRSVLEANDLESARKLLQQLKMSNRKRSRREDETLVYNSRKELLDAAFHHRTNVSPVLPGVRILLFSDNETIDGKVIKRHMYTERVGASKPISINIERVVIEGDDGYEYVVSRDRINRKTKAPRYIKPEVKEMEITEDSVANYLTNVLKGFFQNWKPSDYSDDSISLGGIKSRELELPLSVSKSGLNLDERTKYLQYVWIDVIRSSLEESFSEIQTLNDFVKNEIFTTQYMYSICNEKDIADLVNSLDGKYKEIKTIAKEKMIDLTKNISTFRSSFEKDVQTQTNRYISDLDNFYREALRLERLNIIAAIQNHLIGTWDPSIEPTKIRKRKEGEDQRLLLTPKQNEYITKVNDFSRTTILPVLKERTKLTIDSIKTTRNSIMEDIERFKKVLSDKYTGLCEYIIENFKNKVKEYKEKIDSGVYDKDKVRTRVKILAEKYTGALSSKEILNKFETDLNVKDDFENYFIELLRVKSRSNVTMNPADISTLMLNASKEYELTEGTKLMESLEVPMEDRPVLEITSTGEKITRVETYESYVNHLRRIIDSSYNNKVTLFIRIASVITLLLSNDGIWSHLEKFKTSILLSRVPLTIFDQFLPALSEDEINTNNINWKEILPELPLYDQDAVKRISVIFENDLRITSENITNSLRKSPFSRKSGKFDQEPSKEIARSHFDILDEGAGEIIIDYKNGIFFVHHLNVVDFDVNIRGYEDPYSETLVRKMRESME